VTASSHNNMAISRLLLLSAVALLSVCQPGSTRPYIYSYNFQLPPASAGKYEKIMFQPDERDTV